MRHHGQRQCERKFLLVGRETAQANGIESYRRLIALFKKRWCTVDDYKALLPWNIELGVERRPSARVGSGTTGKAWLIDCLRT